MSPPTKSVTLAALGLGEAQVRHVLHPAFAVVEPESLALFGFELPQLGVDVDLGDGQVFLGGFERERLGHGWSPGGITRRGWRSAAESMGTTLPSCFFPMRTTFFG